MNLDAVLWIAVVAAKGLALAASLRAEMKELRVLAVYFALSLAVEGFMFAVLREFGYRSRQYGYAYFVTDFCLLILGYFVMARLLELAFSRSRLRLPNLRAGALLAFVLTAVLSAYLVFHLRGALTLPGFAVELEQNFSFLGMVLTGLLWVGVNLMQVEGLSYRRVVLAFGVLYSSSAITFTLVTLLPSWVVLRHATGVFSLLAMTLLAYSLLSPENAVASETAAARSLAGAAL